MKKKFKEMKFNVGNNPDISKTIQKRLFKLGYKWAGYGQAVSFAKEPFLYAEKEVELCYGTTLSHFDEQSHQEIDIEWMKQEQRGTVEIGGKAYYEDELAEALSKIKEVE